MNLKLSLFISLLLISPLSYSSSHCDPGSLPDPLTLRSDQLTVLISGFSPLRVPLLRYLAAAYASHPAVASVVVLWSNPSVPPPLVPSAAAVIPHPTTSLNARFLPRPLFLTRALAVCDDDVFVDPPSLSLAFYTFAARRGRSLVGFFARSHHFDLARKSWIYTAAPSRYSILLTKFLILSTDHLWRYSCGSAKGMAEAREVVERERNCEDLLMNFVAAMAGEGEPPVMVEGRRVRDWGDPRNRGNGTAVAEVGLSSRKEHWERRGWCIGEFHRLLGAMPLRYSYGKVAEGAGEQGLCNKGGKLLPCDQQAYRQGVPWKLV